MDRFSVSTHHLVLNEDNTCMGSTAVHRIQYKLNSLEPFIFPLLKDPGFSNCENKVRIHYCIILFFNLNLYHL